LIGTSFSPRRCASLGLPIHQSFTQLIDLRFGVVRVSAYWDDIQRDGYAELDWLLDAARDAGQQILLTVGMKAMRWPEFYLPPDIDARRLGDATLAFVSETVARYRDRREIIAWQVENEPFNRSGPQHRWIHPHLVRQEIQRVRALDARPIVLSAFAHFDAELDEESRPRRFFGLLRLQPEKLILDLIGPSDILGLDVYTTIGTRSADADWAKTAERWLRAARERGRTAWITESQAEPWGPSPFTPADAISIYQTLAQAGFSTILLWGAEHWFWRAAAGDGSWLDAATELAQVAAHEHQ
jgi:hypothetical protein